MASLNILRLIFVGLLSVGWLAAISEAEAACPASVAACTSTSSCQQRITLGSSTLQVYRSHNLNKQNCDVRHAIVVVHGRDLNPADYFGYVTSATKTQGRSNDTLIVSPFFREQTSTRISTDLYWDRGRGSAALYDWAMGGDSVAPSAVSSFDVIDAIIKTLTKASLFPNLKSIVVTGHSGGAQLAQRYAIGGNPTQSQMPQTFFFVPANPSSYAYLDKRRPLNGSTTVFSTPTSTSCRYYDEWGYGLDDPNRYMALFSYSTLVSRYTSRRVTYLLGELDTTTSGIDTTCYANLQGQTRYVRGTAYANYIAQYYQAAVHKRAVVPGVGHNARDMFASAQGRAALFPLP